MEHQDSEMERPVEKKPRTVAIIQARYGSSRLPGKVLMLLAGRSVLDHVISRCRAISSVDAVVCATTCLEQDNPVAEAASKAGAIVYRGDPTDVLLRYTEAARMSGADVILRVTSDCPLIDPEICDRTIRLHQSSGADYTSNNMPRLFPHGLDCEVFNRAILERANEVAILGYDREHVTPWMRRAADVTRSSLIGPGWPAVQQRWTLDYPEDYSFLSTLFALLPAGESPSTESVLAQLADRPEIGCINANRRIASPNIGKDSAPVAVFRFEADEETGLGHAIRCSAFSATLEQLGWRCYWAVSRSSATFLSTSAPPNSLIVLGESDSSTDAMRMHGAGGRCDLLVLDYPNNSRSLESEMCQSGSTVVTFDDLADRYLDADIVLNPSPAVAEHRYSRKLRGDARLLSGPSFAMLRSQFLAHRHAALLRIRSIQKPNRVLVAFGGTDPLNGTLLALDALSSIPVEKIDVVLGSKAVHLPEVRQRVAELGERCNLMIDLAEVARTMAASDLVIGAPGSGVWERACLGIPSVLVGIAENQRGNAKSLTELGAAVVSGFLTTDAREELAAQLKEDIQRVIGDHRLYVRMHEVSSELCDGRGTSRLAAALIPHCKLKDGLAFSVRLAERSDAKVLYDWQQVPETRRFAPNKAPFSFDEHINWLSRKLSSEREWFLIGEADGIACGFIRLDWLGEDQGQPQYVISILAAPGHERRGIGRALLSSARSLVPGGHFFAKVSPENQASVELFRSSAYQLAGDGYFHSYSSLEAVRQ